MPSGNACWIWSKRGCSWETSRRPVARSAWLGEEPANLRQVKALLAPLSGGRDHMLAGERAGRRNNDPSLIAPFAAALGDRNAEGAMNGHRRLAALFVMLALVGCARG